MPSPPAPRRPSPRSTRPSRGTACPKLLAAYDANKHWNYTRWAFAAYEGNSAQPRLLTSGDCLPKTRS